MSVASAVQSFRDLESAQFVWNTLWKRDQSTYLRLNTLDVVQVTTDGVTGWIFTSSDGFVKSKSKARWTPREIADRIRGNQPGGEYKAHFSYNGIDWEPLTCSEDVHELLAPEHRAKATIVSFGHIYGTSTFMEVEFEYIDDIVAPKVTCFMLCGTRAKGVSTTEDSAALPSQRLKSFNKATNELAKVLVTELIKLLENRKKVQVLKLIAVLLLETDRDTDEADKTVWLHHVRKIVLKKKDGTAVNVDGSQRASEDLEFLEKRSSTCSEIIHNTSSFQRITKCMGDFCTYAEEEEASLMDTLEADDVGSAVVESKKARRRNRQRMRMQAANGDIDVDTLTNSTDAENDEDEMLSPNPLRPRDGDASIDEEDRDEVPGLPLKSDARHVPYKSIALARQEMVLLEESQEEGVPITMAAEVARKVWTQGLQHWWWRSGRSIAIKRHSIVPESSAFGIGASMLKGSPDGGVVPKDTRKKPQEAPLLTIKGLKESDNALPVGLQRKEKENIVPYDLSEDNSFSGKRRKNIGEVSWYYSDARVCERCYRAYREMDTRRDYWQKTFIKARKREEDEEKDDREIERRIFNQRKFVSRLAAEKREKERLRKEAEERQKRGSVSDPNGSSLAMPTVESPGQLINGGNSLAFASVMQSGSMFGFPSGQGGQAAANSNSNGRVNNVAANNRRAPVLVGAPKALPPMPWELNDERKLRRYEEVGSAFIRNIGHKAKDVAISAQHLKMMTDMEKHKQVAKISADDSEAYVEEDTEVQWERLTKGVQRAASDGGMSNSGGRRRKQEKAAPARPAKTFDAQRLKHKWQRDMDEYKKENLPEYEPIPLARMPNLSKKKSKLIQLLDGGHANRKNVPRNLPPIEQPSAEEASIGAEIPTNVSQLIDSNVVGGYFDEGNGAGVVSLMKNPNTLSPVTFAPPTHSISTLAEDGGEGEDVDISSWVRGRKSAMKNSRQRDGNLSQPSLNRRSVTFEGHDDNEEEEEEETELDLDRGGFRPKVSNAKVSTPSLKSGVVGTSSPGGFRLGSSGGGSRGGSRGRNDDKDDGESEGDEDDDEAIGWSPFVIPTLK